MTIGLAYYAHTKADRNEEQELWSTNLFAFANSYSFLMYYLFIFLMYLVEFPTK